MSRVPAHGYSGNCWEAQAGLEAWKLSTDNLGTLYTHNGPTYLYGWFGTELLERRRVGQMVGSLVGLGLWRPRFRHGWEAQSLHYVAHAEYRSTSLHGEASPWTEVPCTTQPTAERRSGGGTWVLGRAGIKQLRAPRRAAETCGVATSIGPSVQDAVLRISGAPLCHKNTSSFVRRRARSDCPTSSNPDSPPTGRITRPRSHDSDPTT